MLKLFVKDNFSGTVHEYGTDPHDALILMDDGSLHYEHLQCGVGTMFPEEGFSFCLEDGTIPEWDPEWGCAPYIEIGGEVYKKPMTNADRIRAMSDELLATQLVKVVEETIKALTGLDVPYELLNEIRSNLLEKLQQPAEEGADHE